VRGVRLLIDGIPQTLPDGQGQSSQFALTSADRIEVLKGPIAMLYGNAAGGVVQVFTRSAGDKPEFSVTGYVGSDDLFRTTTQYSEKRGNYGLVLDYATFRTDSFREYSKAERNHLNAKLEYQGEKGKTTFIANVVDNKTQEPGSRELEDYQNIDTRYDANEFNKAGKFGKDFIQGIFGITSEQKINGMTTVSYRAYYGNRDLKNPLGCGSTSIIDSCTDNSTGTLKTGYSMIDRTFYGVGVSSTTKTQVNQIPVSVIAGLDADYVTDRRTAKRNVAGSPVGGLGRNEENIAYNTDAFVQSQWFFSEKYTGLLGARLTRVNLEVKDDFKTGPADDGSGSKRYSGVSPVVGLTRHVSPRLNIFVQAGRGFETPTLNEVLYTPTNDPLLTKASINSFYTGIAAAKSTQVEFGLKWRPDPTTKLDASIFQAKTKDDIVPLLLSTSASTWQNADTIRKGFELYGLKILDKYWAVRGALTVLSAEYDSQIDVLGAGPSNSVVKETVAMGNAMPSVPQRRAFVDLGWRSIGWEVKPASTYSEFGLEANAVGKSYVNSFSSTTTSSYETINVRLSHHIRMQESTLSLYARVDNLTDKKYVGSVVGDQVSSRYYEPGAPRNWLIGAKYTLTM
jgi:iron complex outermembrane recepter protein